MPERRISEDSTIYNYTLVSKWTVPLVWLAVYLLGLAAHTLMSGWAYAGQGLASTGVSLAVVPLLHAGITRLYIAYTRQLGQADWDLRLSITWPGYLPEGFLPFSSYARWLHQISVIGTALISLFYVWLPTPWYLSLLFVHLWLLAPRYLAYLLFRRQKKGGMIRFGERDVSYYLP